MSKGRVVTWKEIILFLLVFGFFTVSHGQKITKCRQEAQKDTPQYKVARVRRVVLDGVPILRLQISVRPEYFDRKHMIALAERLNKDFCNEKHLAVAICDDYEEARAKDLIFDLVMHHPHPGLRGAYDLNRLAGTEGISFSTERGKALDEITINLANQ